MKTTHIPMVQLPTGEYVVPWAAQTLQEAAGEAGTPARVSWVGKGRRWSTDAGEALCEMADAASAAEARY